MTPKNLEVELFVVCDNALISKENKLSIIGIFDHIVVERLPFNFPRMSLVVVVSGQPQTQHSLHLKIVDPTGKQITGLDMQVTLGVSGSSNLLSEITNFPLQIDGEYKIILSQNKKQLATKLLTVSRAASKNPLPT